MGIDQPKISAMLAGRFRGYSVERLMRFLVALGHDVEIVVKPGTQSNSGRQTFKGTDPSGKGDFTVFNVRETFSHPHAVK
jgi:hypothetical protein